ncbi:MAG: flagellar hook-length control protein FliK [bacterium]
MVAGAETAPAGSAPAPPAADALAVQTEWLAARGGGSARLVLHPPELGEIAIRVTLRGESVDVVMVAQEAAARTIAEEQSDRLAQAFSARDLRMESFEVRRADAQPALDPELESRLMDSGSREREQAGGEGAEEGDLRRPVGLRSGAGAASAMTSPGVAAPRTGSVDLRI